MLLDVVVGVVTRFLFDFEKDREDGRGSGDGSRLVPSCDSWLTLLNENPRLFLLLLLRERKKPMVNADPRAICSTVLVERENGNSGCFSFCLSTSRPTVTPTFYTGVLHGTPSTMPAQEAPLSLTPRAKTHGAIQQSRVINTRKIVNGCSTKRENVVPRIIHSDTDEVCVCSNYTRPSFVRFSAASAFLTRRPHQELTFFSWCENPKASNLLCKMVSVPCRYSSITSLVGLIESERRAGKAASGIGRPWRRVHVCRTRIFVSFFPFSRGFGFRGRQRSSVESYGAPT